ncbi:MAG: prepilin-type N-terminal cleavage/methylation domain-containing protein [Gammaproteobacteria bacterium]|nr:prepilin-type N-terminal cleavage/methylation domain-containing protein [Gammaproteobacteria bacterium]MDE0443011.1 prepilin-type N-terminal cleavage/methylation domain-containing protein [Gammaproteobacteria bacterium]
MLTKGVTLVEMLVTLAAASLLLHGYFVWQAAALEDAAVQRTVDGMLLVDEAAYAYHAQQGAWPASMADLVTAGLVPAHPGDATRTILANGTGGAFDLQPVTGGGIRISTRLLQAGDPSADRLAKAVVRSFPHGTAVVGNKVELVRTIPPGAHSDLEVLVRRDGSRAMTGGPLDFAGNGIDGVSAVAFDASVVNGRACSGKRIATASDGALMECVAGAWRRTGASGGGIPCSWSGWLIVDVIGWSAPNVTPPYTAGTVMAWRCVNDRVAEITSARCSYAGTVSQGRGSPTFTLAQCGLAS